MIHSTTTEAIEHIYDARREIDLAGELTMNVVMRQHDLIMRIVTGM